MAGIQLGGLFTGIDTNALITQLMQIEQGALNRYQARLKVYNDRQSAISDWESKLQSLRSAVGALSDADGLRAFTVASSNTGVLTAEASNNAFEGTHTIVVNQLANAERWAHTAGMEYADDLVGAGTFIYSYNHQETTITTTADTTLNDLVGLINSDANNPGVTASLLYYNGAYHLMLNGRDAGSDYAISINASNTEVWQAASALTKGTDAAGLTTRIVDLAQFSGTLAGGESITISGRQHDGTAVSQTVAITGSTTLDRLIREINDAFGGTATATLDSGIIRLTDNTSGASQMTLSLTYDAGSGSTTLDLPAFAESVQGGSTAANLTGFTAADFTQTQSAQDAQIKVDGYPAGADEWITRSSNTIDDLIQGVTLHLHAPGTAQVNLMRDASSIKTKLDALVSAYNEAISFYQDKTGYNASTKVAGVLMGDSVISAAADDLRAVLIRQAQGFVSTLDQFILPGQIGLTLDREGKLSLNADALNEALANDYAGVLALLGADKTGTSDDNRIAFYGASSDHTAAGTYNVEVTIAGGVVTSARIKRADETEYRDAAIQGNVVIGDTTFDDKGNPLYPENGLQLRIDPSQDGTLTATVRVQQGFAGALEDTLDRMLDETTGSLPRDRKHIDDQIQRLQEQITREQDRLTRKQAALVAKFARLEQTLALLQNQMDALGMATTSSTSSSQ
jgi:flagellar hook-associated protein 2